MGHGDGTGDMEQGLEDRGQWTRDRGQRTLDMRHGAAFRMQRAVDRKQETGLCLCVGDGEQTTGDRLQGTYDRGQGTGDSGQGQGTEDR